MTKWFEEALSLSSMEIGWHAVNSDLLDDYFSGHPDGIVRELCDEMSKSVLLTHGNREVVNDVFMFIQGANGPLHFIKDKRLDQGLIPAAFGSVEILFKDLFSSDDVSWSSAWTIFDSFVSYSNHLSLEENWQRNAALINRLNTCALNVANICLSGKLAYDMLAKRHPMICNGVMPNNSAEDISR